VRVIDYQNSLRRLGWDTLAVDGKPGPQTERAVHDFQRAFAWYDIAVDGKPGPQTFAALNHCLARGGRVSAHFTFTEFRCKCGGRYRDCRRVHLTRELVRDLEAYRARIGRGVRIVSGYRCPSHNKAVGGASRSRHLYGDAADIDPVVHWTRVANMRLFGGLGYQGSTGRCRHVDERPVSPAHPTVWRY